MARARDDDRDDDRDDARGGGFKYRKRSKDSLRERANMKGGNFDSIFKPKYKVWKPKTGKNLVRILPPTWDGAEHYGLDVFVNYGIGVDNQSYLSLSKMKNQPDPIAEARQRAEKDGDKDLAKALRANQRILYWIIDRNAEEEGPQLWAAPFGFDKDVLNLCMDEDTKEVIFIDDPRDGCDLRFYKEGEGIKTNYDTAKMRIMKPSPIHEDADQADEWLNYIEEHALPKTLNFYDYEHIAAMFDGQARVNRDDDDEDEKAARRGGSNRSSRDDDEDEKSKPKTRARLNRDEDEEDEKPAGKRDRTEAKPGRESSDAGLQRTRRAAAADGDDDAPRNQKRAARDDDEDEVEEKPARRERGRLNRDEDEEDEKPKSKASRDEDESEEKNPRGRRGKPDPEDEEEEADEKPARSGSLRDRIARRRSRDD